MKIRAQLLILIATITLLIASSVFVYALLQSKKSIDDINFGVGNLTVRLEGAMINDPLLVPGKELVATPYKLINTSTIDIDIQLIIEIKIFSNGTWNDLASNEYEGSNIVVISQTLTKVGDKYLIENIAPNTNINIIDSLILDGLIVRNDYTGKDIKIFVKFSAKQSKHATWTDIGIVDIF